MDPILASLYDLNTEFYEEVGNLDLFSVNGGSSGGNNTVHNTIPDINPFDNVDGTIMCPDGEQMKNNNLILQYNPGQTILQSSGFENANDGSNYKNKMDKHVSEGTFVKTTKSGVYGNTVTYSNDGYYSYTVVDIDKDGIYDYTVMMGR